MSSPIRCEAAPMRARFRTTAGQLWSTMPEPDLASSSLWMAAEGLLRSISAGVAGQLPECELRQFQLQLPCQPLQLDTWPIHGRLRTTTDHSCGRAAHLHCPRYAHQRSGCLPLERRLRTPEKYAVVTFRQTRGSHVSPLPIFMLHLCEAVPVPDSVALRLCGMDAQGSGQCPHLRPQSLKLAVPPPCLRNLRTTSMSEPYV